jgi:hypothetical protein
MNRDSVVQHADANPSAMDASASKLSVILAKYSQIFVVLPIASSLLPAAMALGDRFSP